MLRLFVSLAMLMMFSLSARASSLRIGVQGMDCEQGCPPRVVKALKTIEGIERVGVDFDNESACIESSKPIEPEQISSALGTENYTLGTVESVETCPKRPKVSPADPWADTDGLDAKIVSDGFEFELNDHQAPGKFTLFDFGASWCGPCHVAADRLKKELQKTPDLAVRAISLGHDPQTSFDFPVAKQYMAFAQGLPWFIVLSPQGKKIYEGGDLDKALQVIARKRK